MNAKELRIGNYLRDERSGAYLRVVSINEDNFSMLIIDESLHQMADMFVAVPVKLIDCLRRIRVNGEYISRYYEKTGKVKIQGHKFDNIEYLHHLQNLYFFIVGHELLIDL